MAKKVLPIHLEAREREILRLISKRDGVSMAEVVRRKVRDLGVELVDLPRTIKPTGTDIVR